MEFYVGEIFLMLIFESIRLNVVFGIGILIGLGIMGFLVVLRLGKKNFLKVGCVVIIISFILIVMFGFIGKFFLFLSVLFLYGLVAGLIIIVVFSLMLDLMAVEMVGIFIGVWGLV